MRRQKRAQGPAAGDMGDAGGSMGPAAPPTNYSAEPRQAEYSLLPAQG